MRSVADTEFCEEDFRENRKILAKQRSPLKCLTYIWLLGCREVHHSTWYASVSFTKIHNDVSNFELIFPRPSLNSDSLGRGGGGNPDKRTFFGALFFSQVFKIALGDLKIGKNLRVGFFSHFYLEKIELLFENHLEENHATSSLEGKPIIALIFATEIASLLLFNHSWERRKFKYRISLYQIILTSGAKLKNYHVHYMTGLLTWSW